MMGLRMKPDRRGAGVGSADAGREPSAKGLSTHILPTSATMIGVCMTVLSIGHLGPGGRLRMVVDKMLAVDALVFLLSALLSFMSMRTRGPSTRLEANAELVFIAGLIIEALVAAGLAFMIN